MPSSQHVADALTISPDARIMMRWWWFGPSISCEEVTRQLTLMHQAGIGGVEAAYIYPVCVDGEPGGIASERFLSPAFCRVVRHTADEAQRLGMRLDLTLGSGWPFGGPHIPPRLAARKLTVRAIDVPAQVTDVPLSSGGENEMFLAAVCENGRVARIEQGRLRLDSPAPAASRAFLLTAVPTGQMVKRAALGAEGWVLDHYSEEALQAQLDAVGSVLLDAAGPGRVRAVFTDSLEAYGNNWTDDLLAEFRKRRGYDLAEFLPLLLQHCDRSVDDPDRLRLIHDVQHDYAQTLTELLNDRFLRPLQRFAHSRGVLSRVQAYGVPPATLSSYRHVDLPEGETTLGASEIHQPAEWTEITPLRLASSAGRGNPHEIVSGETWTRLHSPPYAATPLDMKAEADQFFLQGVTQIIGHGWCHRPVDGDPTRWVFYAAGNFNEANPWHPVMGDLARYLQTVSSLLRAGTAVVDVGIYLPDHDVWARQTLSAEKDNLHHVNALRKHIGLDLPVELLRVGYNFDLVDDEVLQSSAEAGSLPYRMIILPQIERIPLATLQALQRLAGRGVAVIALGRVPDQPPGHIERQRDAEAIRQLADTLADPERTPHLHRLSAPDVAMLKQWCTADVSLEQDAASIGYVHRRLVDADLYFFANTTNRPARLEPHYRNRRPYVYQLDPMRRTACRVNEQGTVLPPYGSVFYLLSDRALDGRAFGDFTLCQPEASAPVDERNITEGWELAFPTGESRQLDRVRLWTDWPEYRSFAGGATYRRSFEVPDSWVGRRVVLEFDVPRPIEPHRRDPGRRNTGYATFLDAPIKDAAEVYLNGTRIAAIFSPPYRVDLTEAIRWGENVLEVKVYNRLINAIAAGSRYDFSEVHRTYGKRFDVIQDFDNVTAEPAGLEGAVRLVVHEAGVG